MYLGGEERSLRSLAIYLSGFEMAEWFHELPKEKRLGNFEWELYEKWIRQEYNKERLNLRSFTLAESLTDSQKEAFDLWFSWYDKYNDIK